MGLGRETGFSGKEKDTVMLEPLKYNSINSEVKKEKAKIFSSKKVKILTCVLYGNLFQASCFALMAPFFPAEAEKKGATPTEYGLIFGAFQLSMFFASPIHGKLLAYLQPALLLKCGLLASGICSILFGLLHYAPAGATFIGLALSIRIIQAIGASAFLTASLTILSYEFSDIMGRAMSIVETANCVGLAIGPVMGSFLYNLGGFKAPFFTVGVLLLFGFVWVFFLIPNVDMFKEGKSGNARAIMADFDFMMDMLANITCSLSIAFNEATLEPHIRQFHLSAQAIAGIFVIEGIVDAATAFAWGYFAEKVSNAQYLIMFAITLFIVASLIVGPAPFFPFPTFLWLIIVAQFLVGFGVAGQIVCSTAHAMKNTVERGFPGDVATYGIISGIVFSSNCLGGFIGPSVGGILVEHFGYRNTTLFIFGVHVVSLSLILGRIIWKRIRKHRKEPIAESKPEFTLTNSTQNRP